MSSRTDRLPDWDRYINNMSRKDDDNIFFVGWCNLWNMDSYYRSIDYRSTPGVSAITIRRELEQFSDLADWFASHESQQH